MALDFSQVILITTPSGDVKSISSGGTTLWDSNGKSWHTVWSGNQTITVDHNSSQGSAYHFTSTAAHSGANPILRITFEFLLPQMWPSGYTPRFYLNSTSYTSDEPSSPAIFKRTSGYLVGLRFGGNDYIGAMLSADYDSTNDRLYFTLNFLAGGNIDNRPYGDVRLRVTKIERYY